MIPEDSLEKGLAIHSSIFPWRIPWTEEPGRLQSKSLQRLRQIEQLTLSLSPLLADFPSFPFISEGRA